MTLPSRADWAAAATQAALKSLLGDISEFTARLIGGAPVGTYVLATGSFVPVECVLSIDTEGAAATDVLDTIDPVNFDGGQPLVIGIADASRVVTVTHEVGSLGQVSLRDSEDVTLADPSERLLLQLDATATPNTWVEVARWGFAEARPVTVSVSVAEELDQAAARQYASLDAAGPVTLTLRSAKPGRVVVCGVGGSSPGDEFSVVPSGDVIVVDGVSSATGWKSSTTHDSLALRCFESGTWVATSFVGTWVAV